MNLKPDQRLATLLCGLAFTVLAVPGRATIPAEISPNIKNTAGVLPPLPEALASFGASVAGDWLYVYAGHIGEEHEHPRSNLSPHFRRIQVDGGTKWQELPVQ